MDGAGDGGAADLAWITVALFAAALGWDAAGLDLPLARLAGSVQGFPWRAHWLLVEVLREAGAGWPGCSPWASAWPCLWTSLDYVLAEQEQIEATILNRWRDHEKGNRRT
jgi:hypothetical protein